MKDYEQIGNCNDTYCKYYDESMELNCSYSEDNTKCIRKEKADGGYAVLGEVIHDIGVWGLENKIPVTKTDKLKQIMMKHFT